MVKKILMGIVVVVLVLVILISLQPSTFRVVRSATIGAPPTVVHAKVNDFHQWNDWSPWEKLDPEMKRTYEGPEAGEGAMYSWVGNSNVGEGKMTITESKPGELVLIKLDFIKPMEATSTARFDFKPEGEGTVVTWSMEGENGFMGKAMGLVMNMDKMVGGSFEEGLADLKKVSEAETKPEADSEAETKPDETGESSGEKDAPAVENK